MESILKTVSLEPMELTYLGIGSCPHVVTGQTLEPKHDQLIPICFHEFIVNDKKPMRILHFDPAFDQRWDFLTSYFQGWNLVPMEFEGGMSWVGETLEVILIAQNLEHEEHFWFLESLCESILESRGKLVIQEYTGNELQVLNQALYAASHQKELYKRRILLDMTYGTDTGCCTDMRKAQPFYDYNGSFLNLHEVDAKRWVGISLKLDELLRKQSTTKFLKSLNHIHVDYRRKLKGEGNLYGSTKYSQESSPEEIMKVLQQELSASFDVLLLLRTVSNTEHAQLKTLFQDYKTHDPYKWYEAVRMLI